MAESVSLDKLYRELRDIKRHMVSKEELASLLETWEILHDPETMRQIRESEKDIVSGKTKRVRGVNDLLAELEK
ncbi:hypothetical protein J4211_05970 [Candidatus Woesearchaeota archaeon]|nr:hypothetical protein [Candidatus Woesearchaeota archaeon]